MKCGCAAFEIRTPAVRFAGVFIFNTKPKTQNTIPKTNIKGGF